LIRLALLRHGHTLWNRAGRIQGRTDVALSADAREQLSRLRLPDPWAHADLWSSPLSRAHETATLVSGCIPKTDPALLEMNWGDWEGQKGRALRDDQNSGFRDIEDWGWNYTPPNGESPDAMRKRLLPWVGELKNDAVAVCHIGVMRVLLAQATGWDFCGPAPFRIKRNRLYILHIDPDGWSADPLPVRLNKVVP